MGVISKIDAINHILLMAGESLVNDLDTDSGLDTEVATFLLDRNILDFQMRGLASNTYVKKYNLTDDGIIDLPSDTLSAELVSVHTNSDGWKIKANARQDKDGNIRLYNLTDNNNLWNKTTDYYIELVYELSWTEMDTPIQRSVMANTARQYQLVMQGDADVDSYLAQAESLYMVKGRAADIDDKNLSVFDSLPMKAREVFNRRASNNDTTRFRYWRSKQDG